MQPGAARRGEGGQLGLHGLPQRDPEGHSGSRALRDLAHHLPARCYRALPPACFLPRPRPAQVMPDSVGAAQIPLLWNVHANLLSVQGTEGGPAAAIVVPVFSTSARRGDHSPPAPGVRAQLSQTNRSPHLMSSLAWR